MILFNGDNQICVNLLPSEMGVPHAVASIRQLVREVLRKSGVEDFGDVSIDLVAETEKVIAE